MSALGNFRLRTSQRAAVGLVTVIAVSVAPAFAGPAIGHADEPPVQHGSKPEVGPNGYYATERAPAHAPKAAPTPGVAPFRPVTAPGATKGLPRKSPFASCATGRLVFQDETLAQNPAVNVAVQVTDHDTGSGDDVLANGFTAANGDFSLCFESTDSDEGGGQEVQVVFKAETPAWRVLDGAPASPPYGFATGIIPIADPGVAAFGTQQPANADLHKALHVFDAINRLWTWQSGVNGYLDDPGQNRKMTVIWSLAEPSTTYSLGDNRVHIAADDADSDHVVIHEAAHALMDALYDDVYPPTAPCAPDVMFAPTSPGCAWTEGWADWVAVRVLNDPVFQFTDGPPVNLETPSWDGVTSGDIVEGRVAGALIDLSDSTNDASWDRYSEGGSTAATEEIYTTSVEDVSFSFNEFFDLDRVDDGNNSYLARAAVFQNTIDYSHRDPLDSGQELTRPSLAVAPNPHNYSFTAIAPYWTGVAIRPPASADYDLLLYAEQAQTTQLAMSNAGAGRIDYVVVDGNHRKGTFFPRAARFAGSGSYSIEEYTGGGGTLSNGSRASVADPGDIIQLFDRQVTGGQTNYIRVVPAPGLDVELFAHVSNDATPATTAQGRAGAVADSSSGGPGVAEAISYAAAVNDYTGIVVLNKGGSGAYTVFADIAAPSAPTVQIDGGNAASYDTSVDLTLSATPANTPVTEMQISTDGVFDAEPWQPYATSATATLPAGFSTKTVSVRYRSAAGAISTVATDTIALIITPKCNGLAATIAGFGTVDGTAGPDVIVGGPGDDTINGLGGNDVICGMDGMDFLYGGNGTGADTIVGGKGNDTLRGGAGIDTVNGNKGDDLFTEEAAADGADINDAGKGIDRVTYASRTAAVTIMLNGSPTSGAAGEGDKLVGFEEALGGSGNDTIAGHGFADALYGNAGNDTITDKAGKDTLVGGAGDDTLYGGVGNDFLNTKDGVNGNDSADGGADNDTSDSDPGDMLINIP